MTGFVGANGAGKTTTMRIILGVLAADAGTVTWRAAPLTRAVRHRFGYMPEERGLYPKMTVADQIVYLGRLHGLSRGAARRNTAALLDRLGLGERAGDPLEKLSLGNQQRAQIAAALVHDPERAGAGRAVLRPGPDRRRHVVGVLRERAAAGVPVLFSSHQLDVVERLCDDLVIIADGAIRGRRRPRRRCARATRCRATSSWSTATPAGCATSPGVTRGRPRRRRGPSSTSTPSADDQEVLQRRAGPRPGPRLRPGHPVPGRDLPGGRPMTGTVLDRRPAWSPPGRSRSSCATRPS